MVPVSCRGCGIVADVPDEQIGPLTILQGGPFCESCGRITQEWGPPLSWMLMTALRFARLHGCNCRAAAVPSPGGIGADLLHQDPCPLLRASLAPLN